MRQRLQPILDRLDFPFLLLIAVVGVWLLRGCAALQTVVDPSMCAQWTVQCANLADSLGRDAGLDDAQKANRLNGCMEFKRAACAESVGGGGSGGGGAGGTN